MVRQVYRQTGIQIGKYTDRWTGIKIGRLTDVDRQTYGQTGVLLYCAKL